MLSKEQLKDGRLPYIVLKDGSAYGMFDGLSKLTFDRKVSKEELNRWSLLELENEMRRSIPSLVGKSFQKSCKTIHPASQFLDCPKTNDGQFDYDACIKRLETSIARLKAGEHLAKKNAKKSKNAKKAIDNKADKATIKANKADKAKKTAKRLTPKK